MLSIETVVCISNVHIFIILFLKVLYARGTQKKFIAVVVAVVDVAVACIVSGSTISNYIAVLFLVYCKWNCIALFTRAQSNRRRNGSIFYYVFSSVLGNFLYYFNAFLVWGQRGRRWWWKWEINQNQKRICSFVWLTTRTDEYCLCVRFNRP